MNLALRRSIVAVNFLTILATPLTTFCDSIHRSYTHAKKTSQSESEDDIFSNEMMSFGEGLAIFLTIVGVSAALFGVHELFIKQSDESLYASCKLRCQKLANFYNKERNLNYYGDEKKLAYNIVRNSSYRTNHFLYYKEKLDNDISHIEHDQSNVKYRINSIKYTLDKQCDTKRNIHERKKSSGFIRRFEKLYENQSDLLEFLKNLRSTIITMPEYRQEERDRKKREALRTMHKPQTNVYVFPDRSYNSRFIR